LRSFLIANKKTSVTAKTLSERRAKFVEKLTCKIFFLYVKIYRKEIKMKKIFVLLVMIVTVVGSVASQNSVTEKDIVGTWRDNFGIRYVFDLEKQDYSTGTVTVTGGVKGTYFIQGDDLVIVINNMLMTGNKPLSGDKKTLTFRDNSGNRVILTKIDELQQGIREGTTLSGRYYASRTSYEFTGNNFSGFIDSTKVVWGTFTVSGNKINMHITGDLK
jgi:hypothetical protein